MTVFCSAIVIHFALPRAYSLKTSGVRAQRMYVHMYTNTDSHKVNCVQSRTVTTTTYY
jgi:hypothetical protein